MSTTAVTSTPQRAVQRSNGTATPTGSWRHPAMDVIARRRKEVAFTDRTAVRVSLNVAGLVGLQFLYVLNRAPISWFLWLLPKAVVSYSDFIVWAVRLVLFYNIVESISRLFRREKDFAEIPLTPKQRELLGLDPSIAAPPNSGILTPPRYVRTTPSSRATTPVQSTAPALFDYSPRNSLTGSPTPYARRSATPPPNASPYRVLSDRRGSFSSSTMTNSSIRSSLAMPGTPTPAGKQGLTTGASVLPNNKFYYDKLSNRRDGGNRSFSPSSSMFGSSFNSSLGSFGSSR